MWALGIGNKQDYRLIRPCVSIAGTSSIDAVLPACLYKTYTRLSSCCNPLLLLGLIQISQGSDCVA